jgi:hypothetical protein
LGDFIWFQSPENVIFAEERILWLLSACVGRAFSDYAKTIVVALLIRFSELCAQRAFTILAILLLLIDLGFVLCLAGGDREAHPGKVGR